ncbi:MAG TPA: flagellar export protein FliJ [Candidatus Binatia bacterium]|nr:flagellar export protein FliJ [Candidatus Binatia bacterium]
MPFRFPLQAVLHLRQSIEHQQDLRLHAANQQVAGVRQLVHRLDGSLKDLRHESSQELESGTNAASMRFALELESNLVARRRELEDELLRVTQIRDHQRKAVEQVRREREKFEILYQRDLREYEIQQSRREQKFLDELFLSQQAFHKRR